MSKEKTDFLRFSAYSIKDLITRKMSEDSKFTDQIYEGSNLAILIDLVSYMYQCLMFQLNNAAAESMFSDTQIYENISRLVNMLGYHPKGITPAKATFYLENDLDDIENNKSGVFVPKYAYVDTNLNDKNGRRIYYSLTEKNGFKIANDEVQEFQLTNGKWNVYPMELIAEGNEYEEFSLNIGSDVENGKFCASNMIDVYVYSETTGKYKKWKRTDFEIFTNNTTDILNFANIYRGTDEIYSVKLDENKNYVIKFGNGVVGKKLNKGDKIYIVYLETNGLGGEINIDKLPNSVKLLCKKNDYSILGHNEEALESIVLDGMNPESGEKMVYGSGNNDPVEVELYLLDSSTTAKAEESVEEIKQNAPEWFKIGQRLVTAEDYSYYMKNILQASVVDCKVQNNWEYCSIFYKWLYELGLNGNMVQNGTRQSNGKYYIDNSRFLKYDYKFSDPADSNNVYIWTKMESGNVDSMKDYVRDNMQRLKTMTHEIVLLNPIMVQFAITAAPTDVVQDYINNQSDFDENQDSYIEITLDDNSLYSTAVVQTEIENKFISFFNARNNKLGQNVKFQDLMNDIYGINGIQRIRTIYKPMEGNTIIRDGLCFASWSGNYIDAGDDLEVGNTNRTLLDFQFPELYSSDIASKIVVVRKSINNIGYIKY